MNLQKLKGKLRNPLSGITNKNGEENNVTPDSSNIAKKLFTPCRRIGLNRKKNSKNFAPVLNESTNATPYGSFNDVSDVQHTSSEINIVNETVISNNNSQACSNDPPAKYVDEQNNIEVVNTESDEKLISLEPRVQLEDILLTSPKKTSKRKVDEVYDPESEKLNKAKNEVKQLKRQKHIPTSLNDVGSIENDLLLINQGAQIDDISMIESEETEAIVHKSTISSVNISPKKIQKSVTPQSQSQKSSIQQSQSQEFSDIIETPRSSQLTSEDESLLYNSDTSNFVQSSSRRKKKKSVSGKHKKHASKASSSKQKQDVSETRSVVSTTYDSDSDDDFVIKPRREKRSSMILKKDSNSQSSIKNEIGNTDDKKKLKKLKKNPVVDELNRTEHIRIAENKSYTIVHKGNVISYVKSHDNDVDMKTTESDDNQQPPLNYEVPVPQKSMIIERKDYTSVDSSLESEIENKSGCITSMFDDILNNAGKNKQLVSSRNTKKSKNANEASVSQRMQNIKNVPNINLSVHNNTNPPQNVKQSQITVKSIKSLSSEVKEKSSSIEFSDKTDILKIKKEIGTMENALKVKQDRLARLHRVSAYKKTHDLQALRTVTLRMKRGCQEALIDLLLVLKEHSNEEFDMGTLLHNMKIPNELVGYNEEDDNFV